jgi:dTDP-4-dehydrorhamnose reductase
MSSKILITGANGQLGSELKLITSDHFGCTFVDLEEMDLTDEQAIHGFFEGKYFDFVINCAAYTAVDRAEEDKELAYRVNSDAVKVIATICLEKKMRLIPISTDYVFDGYGNKPIAESATPNPLSIYGKSKLAGELHVQRILKDAYVIRTAWVYSTFGKNFVKTISKFARERDTLNVVYDQIGSPTYARDLASTIVKIVQSIESGKADVPGTYHYTNEGVTSWYDLARFIVEFYKLPCRVNAIPTEEYKTAAVRPGFTVLDKRKIKNTFGLDIPHWHESLLSCLNELKM